jgi:hypothetical protein
MISTETYKTVMAHAEELDSAIIYDKDFNYNYFGFKTMEVTPSIATLTPAILSLAHRREGRRKATTHDHACCCRHPWERH